MGQLSLSEIAERARHHVSTPEQRRAQRISLLMGLRSHESTLSRDDVTEFIDKVEGHETKSIDNPGAWWQTPAVRACCSESDAVYADVWQIMPDGSIRATVTGGGPRSHAWAPVGKVYEIPADKILREPGNPTGRALLFIRQGDLHLYCFAMGPLI